MIVIVQDDTDYNRKTAMVDVCILTMGSICKHLSWSVYRAQLKNAMTMLGKTEHKKMAVRYFTSNRQSSSVTSQLLKQ